MTGRPRRVTRWIGVAILLGLGDGVIDPTGTSTARAAFPGSNGPIVLAVTNAVLPRTGDPVLSNGEPGSDADLFTISPGSNGLRRVTEGPANDWWPAWSPDGRHIAFARAPLTPLAWDIFVLNTTTGQTTNLTNSPLSNDTAPSWSPDGSRLAFTSEPTNPIGAARGGEDVFVMEMDGGEISRLTNAPGDDFDPAWSPDGEHIAYSHGPPTPEKDLAVSGSLWIMGATGSNPRELVSKDAVVACPSWSPGGQKIAFTTYGGDVWVVDRDGSDLRLLTNLEQKSYYAAWSPDGRWIAFTSEKIQPATGVSEGVGIYKMRPDGSQVTPLVDISITTNAAPRVDWGPRP